MTAHAAEALVAAEQFDLVILDLNLPRTGRACRCCARCGRRATAAAVMILTARGAAEDRVRGLDLGADDYMAKPFDIREFEARVRSLVASSGGAAVFDRDAGRAVAGPDHAVSFPATGQPIDLPPRERALLELLFMRAGKVVAKEAIVQSVTSLEDILSDNAIEQYISRLRRRIAAAWPEAAHGARHRLSAGKGRAIRHEALFAAPPPAAVAVPGHRRHWACWRWSTPGARRCARRKACRTGCWSVRPWPLPSG